MLVHIVDERFKLINVCEKTCTSSASDAIDRLRSSAFAASPACINDTQLAKRMEMTIQVSVRKPACGLQVGE